MEQTPPASPKGSLTLFLSYSRLSGATTTLLNFGITAQQRGQNAVIAILSDALGQSVQRLSGQLPQIDPHYVAGDSQSTAEIDLPALLELRPDLVLIDELEHTFYKDDRWHQRREVVEVLLAQGIDVAATLCIDALDSVVGELRHPKDSRHQSIPDTWIRQANRLLLVDPGIEEVRERIRRSTKFTAEAIDRALQTDFSIERLSLLRKIGLQEVTSDQLRRIELQENNHPYLIQSADEAVMVAISEDMENGDTVIRKAARLAAEKSSRFFLVYVQKRAERFDSTSARYQPLQNWIELAEQLGGQCFTLPGQNIAKVLIDFAVEHHVRHAVFGRTRKSPFWERIFGSILSEFLFDSIGVDVHIVSPYIEPTPTGVPV